MTKYVGRHRKPPKTPWKTITLGAVTVGVIAAPTQGHHAPVRMEQSALVRPTEQLQPPIMSDPVERPRIIEPPREGNGFAEYKQWVDSGQPGYIPDPGSIKNGNSPEESVEPLVVRVEATCQRAPASTLGLSPNAATVYETICALFPEITEFGGLRPGDPLDHGSGNAIDAMIDPANGDLLAQWLIDHWSELPLKYIIWEQRISYGGEWQGMEDRGSPTQNHMDHVHISVY